MAFPKLPLHLRCLLIPFGIYAKKDLELVLLLLNERFGGKKNLVTKTYNLATEIVWVSRQLAP